jgi:hypothetical protein
MVLVEFKNYDKEEVGKDEVIQTSSYMRQPMGRLALMVVNKDPDGSAYIKRNSIYSEFQRVIMFLKKDHLKEMLYMKERDEDPADLVMDAIERFYHDRDLSDSVIWPNPTADLPARGDGWWLKACMDWPRDRGSATSRVTGRPRRSSPHTSPPRIASRTIRTTRS